MVDWTFYHRIKSRSQFYCVMKCPFNHLTNLKHVLIVLLIANDQNIRCLRTIETMPESVLIMKEEAFDFFIIIIQLDELNKMHLPKI